VIAITDNTLGLWGVDFAESNWLACLSREGGKLVLVYRFRYFEDDRTFGSNDRFSWYRGEPKGEMNESQMIQSIREVWRIVQGAPDRQPCVRAWEILKGERSLEEMADLFSAMPGTYMHTAELETADCEGHA
jgi:hypothetical protein